MPIPGRYLTQRIKTFEQFCQNANYPAPFPKQLEMRSFVMDETDPRLLLGSRGYGKTDYAVILGVSYQIYCEASGHPAPQFSCLLISKSEERNSAVLAEMAKALLANGVALERENSTFLRVQGLMGKEHSASAITLGSISLRGRHPKLIIMEDVVTPEDVSLATRKKVQRVYNECHKLCPNIAVVGQPVHKDDLYETLRPNLKKMEVPYGSIPELDADLEAQRLAGVSEESIQSSYYLKVVSENMFPFESVKYIDQLPPGASVAFIDPSFEGGDHTALSILRGYFDGVAIQGHVWKRAWNHCLNDEGPKPGIISRLKQCSVQRLCFETNSLGDQPIIMLREALPGVGVVGKKSNGNKHSRILAAGAYAHLIHLSKKSDPEYTRQVVKYEYGAAPDDGPDSAASLLEWVGLIRGKK